MAVAAHAQAISSATSESARQPRSLPPYSSGTQMPKSPDSRMARIESSGYASASS